MASKLKKRRDDDLANIRKLGTTDKIITKEYLQNSCKEELSVIDEEEARSDLEESYIVMSDS